MKLNQLIAIVAGKKAQAVGALRSGREVFGNASLFEGHVKTYTPYDEGGEVLPMDSKKIQVTWRQVLSAVFKDIGDAGDVVAGIDLANTHADADVFVNNEIILEAIPATQLIFLEKQLQEVKKVVAGIPTLDPSVTWSRDDNQGWFVSRPVRSIRTQKIPTAFVKAEATPQHPAQVDLIGVDKGVGDWLAVRQSAAVPLTVRAGMLERIDTLITAVVQARETANMTDAAPSAALSTLLRFVMPKEEGE